MVQICIGFWEFLALRGFDGISYFRFFWLNIRSFDFLSSSNFCSFGFLCMFSF